MFVAPIPFLWLVRGSRPGRAALCGFAFGFAYFGALLYWILLFGELGWAGLVIMSAGFTAAFGALAPAVWRREHALLGTFGLAGLWTVIEWVRGMIPLGGFGWGQLGVTQVDAPALPLASIGGVWALSFLVMVVAGLLLLAWERWGSGRRAAALVLAVAALVLAVVPAAIPIPAPDGRTLDVATIQVDVASVQDLVGADEDVAVARLNIDRHLQLADSPPDLVVWGEGALDPGVTSDPLMMTAVSQAIATVGAPTIAGAVTDDPDGTQRTVTLAFDATGKIVDRYVKVKLVPFGEYVPFRRELGWISATDQVPVDRTPGTEVSLISIPGLPPIGTPICYENSFPSIDREMTREGAGFLVVVINNASYDRTAASEQHLQMSRLRAVENGRWVVHAAVSGISAFIDERGDVVDSRGLFEPATMRAMVRASDRRTALHASGGLGPVGIDDPGRRADRAPEEPQTPAARAGTAAGAAEDARDPAHVQRTSDDRGGPRRSDGDGGRARHPGGRRRLTGRHGRRSSGSVRRPMPVSGWWSARASRGSRARTRSGSGGRSPRGTTWPSRWTRTCRTGPRSSPGSWRPPNGITS